ncbi:hypothetical protein [Shewanella algae]|uniref:hypothetical protein n=1 Tax=Shewanella algae TaxID=38313 RepID=UPI001BF0DA96|nr:hypothetical protein [Shewanella algae]BCV29743.1 hypothetical protein TUM3811_36030 [Shewanella algae]
MQGIAQWQSAQPTDEVQRYLNRLDDYDAPYMLIIQLNTEVAASIEILNTLITEFELDAECVEKLSDSMLFLALEYLSGDDEAGQIQSFAREFQTRLTALGILSHGAIVHHNCLGQAEQSRAFATVCHWSNESLTMQQTKASWPSWISVITAPGS